MGDFSINSIKNTIYAELSKPLNEMVVLKQIGSLDSIITETAHEYLGVNAARLSVNTIRTIPFILLPWVAPVAGFGVGALVVINKELISARPRINLLNAIATACLIRGSSILWSSWYNPEGWIYGLTNIGISAFLIKLSSDNEPDLKNEKKSS